MATNMSKVLKHLHDLLAPPGAELTDGELLARFVTTRDEAAFAALVRRHGPMVLSVGRRMLHHTQDAEDCFQATFMVLARKAATVKRESVASWLYSVAYRTALEARAVNARRRARERQVHEMPHPEILPPEAQDWRPWLDQELNRLPEPYRAAIVTCDLEGRSRKEAARLLGLSEGTLSSRLARGRRLLAKRLAPYGLSLPAAALAATLGGSGASGQVPAALLATTTKAAVLVAAGKLSSLPAYTTILMKGVLKSMFAAKLKLIVGALLIVATLGASGLVYRASGQPNSAPAEKEVGGKQPTELEILRREVELLKLKLEVVQEKQRTQEAELAALRATRRDSAKPKEAQPGAEAKPTPITGLHDNKGHLQWPKALRSEDFKETREKVSMLWQRAYKNTPSGNKPDALTLNELQLNLHRMRGMLDERVDRFTPDEYVEAHRFLRRLLTLPSPQERNRESKPKPEQETDMERKLEMLREQATWSQRMSRPGRQYVTTAQAEADQARLRSALFDQAEASLKVLRAARDAESQRKAADALDKALKELGVHKKQPDRGGTP